MPMNRRMSRTLIFCIVLAVFAILSQIKLSTKTSLIRFNNNERQIVVHQVHVNATVQSHDDGIESELQAEELFSYKVSSNRSVRFPSVEERVKLYMSSWYIPPCKDYKKGFVQYSRNNTALLISEPLDLENSSTFQITSTIRLDSVFHADQTTIQNCTQYADFQVQAYCRDVENSILSTMDRVKRHDLPLLLQFGDDPSDRERGHVRIPHLKKFRPALERNTLIQLTTSPSECHNSSVRRPVPIQPILWKLNTARHYGNLDRIPRIDIGWTLKRNQALFWGAPTGFSLQDEEEMTDKEKCLHIPRCRLVYRHANSSLVRAKLVRTRGRFNETIDGISLVGGRIMLKEMLQYKAIIILEGNDVASGLKWALLSNSVVLMPKPTFTSYAMEELLQAWVHFVPLHDNLTDVEDKMQWILGNDKQARWIAKQGSLWIYDLLFHPNAARDNERINHQILRRYSAHFRSTEIKTQ